MQKKTKPIMAYQCDWCGNTTENFVVNGEHKYFCRYQTPGHLPTKDCMQSYLDDLKKNPIIPLPNTIYKSDFYS